MPLLPLLLDFPISIHALREEGDWIPPSGGATIVEFLSTPSARRATRGSWWCRVPEKQFLSTPSARRATLRPLEFGKVDNISIHALREEGDPRQIFHRAVGELISIHALREEGDLFGIALLHSHRKFLSTPSARRATKVNIICKTGHQFLSTPSARRATRMIGESFHNITISIHALREEGDAAPDSACPTDFDFYPRPPRGGRLCKLWAFLRYWYISIHALREEGDWTLATQPPRSSNFYPRPPRGGRPVLDGV